MIKNIYFNKYVLKLFVYHLRIHNVNCLRIYNKKTLPSVYTYIVQLSQ